MYIREEIGKEGILERELLPFLSLFGEGEKMAMELGAFIYVCIWTGREALYMEKPLFLEGIIGNNGLSKIFFCTILAYKFAL